MNDAYSKRFDAAAEELATKSGMNVDEAKNKMTDMIEAFRELELIEEPITEETTSVHSMWFDGHTEQGYAVMCTCGSKKAHPRGKVLVTWAKRHTQKTGHPWRGQNGMRDIDEFEGVVG